MTNHWDELSKSLAESVPRRESLRRLGFVLAGTVLSPFGLQSALAGKQDPCKSFCKCRNKRQQDQCLKACKACGKNTSRLVGTCGGYSCCATGQTSCGSFCAHLGSDVDNCGGCGNVCDQPGQYEYCACINGACRYECAEGALRCDGMCTYVGWDAANCGACGNACGGETPFCYEGVCVGCPHELTMCDTGCVDVDWDANNCGACGNACGGSTPYCSQGVCRECPPGTTSCGGYCTWLDHDLLNCGACGVVCGGGEECYGGACHPAVPPGDGTY
jgi:hypothetical protein